MRSRHLILLATTMLAMVGFIVSATAAAALPAYAAATGQPCSTCHVNPAGGGTLTSTGQAFAAIPTHATNPAAAFAQVSAPAKAPAPAAPAPAPAAPAPAAAPAGAAPATLPSTGEVEAASALPLAFSFLGAAFAGLGLRLRRRR